MTDFVDQLNRRVRRKQDQEPDVAPVEPSEAGVPVSPTPPTTSRLAPLPPEPAAPLSKAQGGEGDIALVFAPGGPVANLLGQSYRPRRGQALMARLVKRALENERHALIEAGTGSGKSFACLIPLAWTGKRVFQVRRTAKARCT